MAIKELRKTWSDCQLDYVREFIATKESDVEKLPTCCVGSTCVVSETNNRYVCGKGNQWKLREKAMEEGDAVVKSINGVLPDAEGNITSHHTLNIVMYDNTCYPGGQVLCYTHTAKDIVSIFRNTTMRMPLLLRYVASRTTGAIVPNVHLRWYYVDRIDGGFAVRLHFGDEYADIIANEVDNTFTLDPDWVKPASGGGGGIKTAIFRNEHFDEYMGGDETAYSTGLECVNMTREEMIQTIESGQPVDYIILSYGDSGVGLIASRPREPRIEWYPEKNELRIAGAGYWFPNGYIGDLAE